MNAANVIPLSAPQKTPHGSSARRAAPNPVCVRFDAFELDEANARLFRDGTAVDLAPRPFGLLCVLARRPGSLLTKNELLDDVWGHQFVSESVLKTAISDVRTVLDDHPREPRFIETVSRRGYRFIAPTTAITSTNACERSQVGVRFRDTAFRLSAVQRASRVGSSRLVRARPSPCFAAAAALAFGVG